MTVLVLGVPDSGKSKIAEDICVQLAEKRRIIYLATMIPYGAEGKERVLRHQRLRQGKGFTLVEQPCRLQQIEERVEGLSEAVVLLECISNLVANEMFAPEGAGYKGTLAKLVDIGCANEDSVQPAWGDVCGCEKEAPGLDLFAVISGELNWLIEHARHVVFVSNRFNPEQDEETARYIAFCERVNTYLQTRSDRVIEIG